MRTLSFSVSTVVVSTDISQSPFIRWIARNNLLNEQDEMVKLT